MSSRASRPTNADAAVLRLITVLCAVLCGLIAVAAVMEMYTNSGSPTDAIQHTNANGHAASSTPLMGVHARNDDVPVRHDDEHDAFDDESVDEDEAKHSHSHFHTQSRSHQKDADDSGAATNAAAFDEDETDLMSEIDDDEFVAAEPVKPTRQQQKASSQKSSQPRPSSSASRSAAPQSPSAREPTVGNVIASSRSFIDPFGPWEYLGLGLLVVYVLNAWMGCRTNANIANKWRKEIQETILADQFAWFGMDAPNMDGQQQSAQTVLQKESESQYQMYATGRRHVNGMMVTLDLQARQDLFSKLLALADLTTSKDTMTLDVSMSDDSMDSFVFALVRKKFSKKFLKSETDVESMCAASKTPRAHGLDRYVTMSELAEVEEELITDKVSRLLSNPRVESHFISAHFTDQVALPWTSGKKLLRFKFVLPARWTGGEGSSLEAVQQLTKLALYWIDRVGEMRLSPQARSRAEARRKKLAEQQQKQTVKERQETVLKRKEEQRQRELEIIKNDPNSALAKELLRKKEAREAKQLKKARNAHVKILR